MDRPVGRLSHLPALDGLRAVAVAAVVAYHLELPGAGGGFLGVDLFFVISGFLITTLLLRERDATGTIAVGAFWNRRFRRLVPPLVVMTATVVVATRIWGIPEQWASVRGDAIGALAYVANWRFIVDDQSYFETLFAPSPLRHTWSLAVEEQWYLVWPLVVGAIAGRRRTTAMVGLATAAVASAGLMWAGHDPLDPSTVYYATHTRAQQLIVGALLAWVLHGRPDRLARRSDRVHRRVALVGLLGFVGLVVTVRDGAPWLYHGGFLVVSVWCAVLVYGVATVDGGALPELGARWLQRIGARSYSIYLWHWPVILFVGPPIGIEPPGPVLIVVRLAAIAVLVELTHRLVERPLRNRVGAGSARPLRATLSWAAATVVVVATAPLLLRPPDDRVLASIESIRPSAVTAAVVPSSAVEATMTSAPISPSISPSISLSIARATGGSAVGPRTSSTTSSLPVGPRRMLLYGDSTALAVAVGSTIAPDIAPGWHAEAHATLGCAITPGAAVDVGRTVPTATNEACVGWEDEWAASDRLVAPDVAVLMLGSWEVLDHLVDGAFVRHPGADWEELVASTLRRAVAIAHGSDGSTPVLVVELPCMRQEPNDIFSAVARNDPVRIAAFNEIARELAAADPLTDTIDVAQIYCEDGAPIGEVDGETLRYDGVHVTPFGADLTWRWIAARADELVPRR